MHEPQSRSYTTTGLGAVIGVAVGTTISMMTNDSFSFASLVLTIVAALNGMVIFGWLIGKLTS